MHRRVPSPGPIPSWSLVPPISMPRTGGRAMRFSELRAPAPSSDGLLGGEAAEEVVDDPVEDDLVERFDDAHVVDGGVEVVMGERFELAAGEAGDADGGEAVVIGPRDGLEDIRAVSRAGDREQDVTWGREVLELLEEDAVIAFVVCPGHDAGGVIGQAQDFEPLLVIEVAEGALGQIFAEVRGIGAGAAVAADENESAFIVGGFDELGDFLDLGRIELLDFAADDGEVFGNAEFCTEHQYFTWNEGALVVGC